MTGGADYDALVIGARVAGATLAAFLGEAGQRVLLVDRGTFPSPTLSTHYFRGGRAVAVFQRLGVLDEMLSLGPPPLVHNYSHRPGALEPTVDPAPASGEIGYSLSVRREPLDHLLLRLAGRTPNVEVLEGARLSELLWEDDRVTGGLLKTADGERRVLAKMVVGADGRKSFVARAVNAPVEERDSAARGVYYQYVRGWTAPGGGTPDGAEFARIDDEMGYIFPSDAGTTCIALSANLVDYAWLRKAREERFRERIMARPGLADRFAAAEPVGPLLGCGPEENYVRVPIGPGWALVGDAGLHQDPWSGHGIDSATVHAAFLAEALIDWRAGRASETEALAAYHRRRNEQALEIYRRTVTMARDLRQLAAAPPSPAAAATSVPPAH